MGARPALLSAVLVVLVALQREARSARGGGGGSGAVKWLLVIAKIDDARRRIRHSSQPRMKTTEKAHERPLCEVGRGSRAADEHVDGMRSGTAQTEAAAHVDSVVPAAAEEVVAAQQVQALEAEGSVKRLRGRVRREAVQRYCRAAVALAQLLAQLLEQ